MKLDPRRLGVAAAAAVALSTLLAGPAVAGTPWWAPTPPKPAAPVCQGPAITKANGSAWTCTFDDEFNGSTLDATKWIAVTTASNGVTAGGTGPNTGCFVNSSNNISVSNGLLNLTARKESAPLVCKSPSGNFATQYTSGQVATYTKFSQTYGRFAVRARFPAATVAGLQSSLWMWPASTGTSNAAGEMDIAEEYSQYADRAIPTLHYQLDPSTVSLSTDTNVYTNYSCTITDVNAFHEYALEWTPTTITVTYDGQTCITDNVQALGASPFNQPYFIALTQALGIGSNAFDPATTSLPATTQIDWVRAWK